MLQSTTITFPIVGGALDLAPKNVQGEIFHSGGLAFRLGANVLELKSLVIDNFANATVLTALLSLNGSLLGPRVFGYTHMLGGYSSSQAQYARVPYADVGPIRIPDGNPDEKVVFLSDIFPTGYMGAEACDIRPGDTIEVSGCGPVAQFAIRSCFMLGAGRVIAIDRVPERLELVRAAGAQTLNFNEVEVVEALREMTGNRGPDACVDVVGLEASGHGAMYAYGRATARWTPSSP